MKTTKLLTLLDPNKVFSKQDFREIILQQIPNYSESSITLLLKKLRDEKEIISVGCGKYILAQSANVKNTYSYTHSTEYDAIEQYIVTEFPLIDFQMWELIQVNEFINHQIGKNLFIVEVETMLTDTAFELLHDKFPYTLFQPTTEQFHRQKGIENNIVVLKLISEAPTPYYNHSCCLEKILVDLFSNKFTGNLIERSEYIMLYEEAFRKYQIDENKMFRYAKRRNLEKTILKFIKEKTTIALLTR